jgi:hypothetical protein
LRATHARTLQPAALASVSFGFVLVRVRVRFEPRYLLEGSSHSTTDTQSEVRGRGGCRTEQQLLTTYSTEELYFTVRTVVPCWTAL